MILSSDSFSTVRYENARRTEVQGDQRENKTVGESNIPIRSQPFLANLPIGMIKDVIAMNDDRVSVVQEAVDQVETACQWVVSCNTCIRMGSVRARRC